MSVSSQVAALVGLDAGGVSTSLKSKDFKAPAILTPFTFEKLATNTNGDTLQLARVHKSWIVSSLLLGCDALSGMSDINVGLVNDYPPDHALAATVAESAYADALNYAAGQALTEIAFANRGIDKMGQQVWQDAGAASEVAADEYYRIAIFFVTGGTATGTISGRLLAGVPNF